jgi:two-component system clock-associated histidine kinase SasA
MRTALLTKFKSSRGNLGKGIPEEEIAKTFFLKTASGCSETNFKQTVYGFGLSLCQGIIRATTVQIWVDSVTRQGSLFSLCFTLQKIKMNLNGYQLRCIHG